MVEWHTEHVNSWDELTNKLDGIAYECLFRGQADASWELISFFQRTLRDIDEETALRFENDSILRFRSEAHLHLTQSVLPPNPFKLDQMDSYVEWLMLMQHYGAPTRLLDWTDSPYVALYFAVMNETKSDAAIWYFNHNQVRAAFYQYHGRPFNQPFDFVTLPATAIQSRTDPLVVYVLMKKMRTAREIMQQGCFTLVNRILISPHEALQRSCPGLISGRLIVPARLKEEIRRKLRLMNVTAAALFPGVEGICETVREDLLRANEEFKRWRRATQSPY